MPRVINEDQIKRYWSRRGKGYPMRAAATYAGFSLTTAQKFESLGPPLVEPRAATGARVRRGQENAQDLNDPDLPRPRRYDELCPEAQEAWNSFPYFQERYLGRRPIPWQSLAGEYVIQLLETADEEYAVVNAPPGCLSGETLIKVNRQGNTRTVRLDYLVDRWNGGIGRGQGRHGWDLTILTRVQVAAAANCKTGGTHIRLGELAGATSSGPREVWRLTTRNGRSIKATADHHFAIDGGGMVPLSDLEVGDALLVNGGQGGRHEGGKQWYDTCQGLVNHPQRGAWPYRQPLHRLMVEADRSGLPLSWYLAILRDKDAILDGIVFLDPLDAVHHLDEDTHHNELSNLEVKRHVDHWRDHGLDGGWAHVASHVELDLIASIQPVGIEETYDLELDKPPHNFVANEFVVHNSGKTLVFTHDIPAWLTVRNRAIRGQLGSVTGALAERYTRRLRNTLERTLPFKAPTDQLEAGTAIDAVATLAGDFGYFKPLERELWTANQFVVAQYADEGSAIEKEATWTAYGFDMGFIGGRFNFVAWDDLVDPKRQRTVEAREQLEVDWDDQGETRLEPGGCLLLNGQRLFANDLYRYNLDKIIPTLVDDDTGEIIEAKPKYHHLIFKAHDTDFCREGTHARGAPAWDNTPEGGCLLSPRRLPYTKLMGLKANSPRFEVVYQQQDVDPEDVLVRQEWIEGDSSHPGCYDHGRARLELPFNLEPPLFSCMSIDPSPTKYWGIEWLVHQSATKLTYLMDLERKVMDAPDLLDYNPQTKMYTGLLEEWWQTSCVVGPRITHVIVEINAAQRFLLQYAHVRAWCQLRSVTIVPHSTHRNKSDPEYGVQMLAPEFEFGRLRLPYRKAGDTRMKTTFLVSEVTKYGSQAGKTTDLTMALWFFFHQLPNICHVDHVPKQSWRPTWMRQPANAGGRDARGNRV